MTNRLCRFHGGLTPEVRIFQKTAATALLTFLLTLSGCTKERPSASSPGGPGSSHPSILLVTLDTTRADAIGPDAREVDTPSFNGIASTGLRFTQAYTTAPQTLPSHASMMTGLYPAGHGLHENARYLVPNQPLLAERLHSAGYHTAAFISGFPLLRRFGLARGFDVYDDELDKGSERSAKDTTDRVLSFLDQPQNRPLFLWVHYYDPHHPYAPPEPYRGRYHDHPYLGEVAAMDEQLGRLLAAFESKADGTAAIVIAGDHGEALGEHGEAEHGNLLYQGVMHVPLVLSGPGITPGVSRVPVSVRRIFHTILDWAGIASEHSLRKQESEVVLGEAMIPFLQYGWQPQVMAVQGTTKVIQAGKIEAYDVVADPEETRDLAGQIDLSRALRQGLREYPLPSNAEAPAAETISAEDRRQLASLGYIASEARPVVRKDAPRPVDMAYLFEDLDRAGALFANEDYLKAIPLFEKILAKDPHNLMAAVRLAVAYSSLGQTDAADSAFRRAQEIAPASLDVTAYRGLHYVRIGRWREAEPLLEEVLARSPDRLPVVEAMAQIREHQGRLEDALRLFQQVVATKEPTPAELVHQGELAMAVGNTQLALHSFEAAKSEQQSGFVHDLELGVLYIAAGRFREAADALDRVPPSHPGYPMALFKRAQVSVLLREPDSVARIALARQHADDTTRDLIERERLFRDNR